MYYATKRNNNNTRLVGLIAVVAVNGLMVWALASGFGAQVIHELTNTEVVIIETPPEIEEEPPPPPPVDVDLPPPPPQVILPDFIFEAPPSETAIRQVEQVREPARPAEVRPPPPKAVPAVRPACVGRCSTQMGDLMAEFYPAASKRNSEEGSVSVKMCVDANGRISDVGLIRSSGFPRLDEATLKFLPRMRVTAAKDSAGKSVPWCDPPYTMEVVWQLKEAR